MPAMPESSRSAAGGSGIGAICATITWSMPKPSFSLSLVMAIESVLTVSGSRIVTR